MKYAVMEVTVILGDKINKDLEIIEAENEEQAVEIYKSARPYIDRYGCEVRSYEV